MNERSVLTDLAVQFALLSLMSIGGIIAVVPEMHAAVVETHNWMSSTDFVTLFALAQAAPGPNVIVVTLIGWKVAGALGALVATLAVSTPSFLIAYTASRFWSHFNALDWYRLFERGIAPVTIGLILSSGLLLTNVATNSWSSLIVTALTVASLLRWRNSPLIALGCAALAGLAGFV
jgi:chromate transporter